MAHLTFIHGISNKPAANELHQIWRNALRRAAEPVDLDAEDVTSEMVYWADVLYAEPLEESQLEAVTEAPEFAEESDEAIPVPGAADEEEAEWIRSMSGKLGIDPAGYREDDEQENNQAGTTASDLEWIPLPGPLKDRFLKRFLRDVHHYLFNSEFSPRPGETFQVQDEIRDRFISAIRRGNEEEGPHVVVSHSMGTVIAYDCLKRVPGCPRVDTLITLGSPLGIDEIQQKLKPEWSRKDGFPSNTVVANWLNIFDPLDVVSRLDPRLVTDFKKNGQRAVDDRRQNHDGLWTHDLVKYFQGEVFSLELAKLLEL